MPDQPAVGKFARPVIFVGTGEVWAVAQKLRLSSDGIGSCVVVAAYDPLKMIGALAHVMLPHKGCKKSLTPNTKYAEDAVDNLLFKMTRLGADVSRITACMVGGGNVLQDCDDTLCAVLVSSVRAQLAAKGIAVVAEDTGGTIDRKVTLDVASGVLYWSRGPQHIEKILWQWEKTS